MIRDFITNNFPKSNLDPEESLISSDIHLRFELGDELENGTTERVDHCVTKAIKLFELLFSESDEIYIMLKSFKYEGANEFFEVTEGYLEGQLSNFDKVIIDERFASTSETDEFYDPETDMSEVATITTHHIQKIFMVNLSDINYQNILKGIANLEMGLSPAIAENIYFINKSKKVVFNMYDDRGCIVYASNLESIRFLYRDLYSWLVEYHIKTFDNLFKRA